MNFVNPYFLIALGAGALPIVIHLLTRDRVRKVAFSSLRFFAQSSRTVLRRKRFAEMVLIALRVLACLLLAFIFARPLFSTDGGTTGPESATVIVIDTSASMTRSVDTEGLQMAYLDVIDDLRGGAQAAVITFDATPRILQPLTGDQAKLRTVAGDIRVGHGGTDIAAAVEKARQLLAASDALAQRVVLISDFQRTGWQRFNGTWRLPPGAELIVRDVKPDRAPDNLAIVEAQAPQSIILDRQPRYITARIANDTEQDQQNVEVTCEVSGEQIGTQRVQLPAGKTATVRFTHVFTKAGDNRGVVRIAADDAVQHDNAYYFNARVIPRIPIVVLGNAAQGRSNPVGFFAAAALAPSDRSPFVVKPVIASQATAAQIDAASVVVVADVSSLSADVVSAIKRLLSRGGGLLLMPADRTDADTFARTFAGITPCKLRRVINQPIRQNAAGLTQIDYTHPVFELFLRPHHGDFSSVQVRRYWEVSDSQLSNVLARFDDGRPAILERAIDSGISMIWLTPAHPNWNNLPERAIYLPLLHQCIRRLAVRTEKQTAYLVGDTLPLEVDGTIVGPDDVELASARSVAQAPGFYQMTGENAEPFVFAVNQPFEESQSDAVDAEEIIAALEQPTQPGQREVVTAGFAGRALDDQGLWLYVLGALLVLLAGELLLGNRTVRH